MFSFVDDRDLQSIRRSIFALAGIFAFLVLTPDLQLVLPRAIFQGAVDKTAAVVVPKNGIYATIFFAQIYLLTRLAFLYSPALEAIQREYEVSHAGKAVHSPSLEQNMRYLSGAIDQAVQGWPEMIEDIVGKITSAKDLFVKEVSNLETASEKLGRPLTKDEIFNKINVHKIDTAINRVTGDNNPETSLRFLNEQIKTALVTLEEFNATQRDIADKANRARRLKFYIFDMVLPGFVALICILAALTAWHMAG
ncbi:hypothetical protein SAMN04488527_11459 [Aliiroseovarius crassostreae]|uniref:Uncharacterized protein n=2 Tax=Aliiroseovarius crassostreae TaxID=154981 RepID=A0A0P7IEJ0_9RHOB|nr:hypothetical protein AKJ29_09250 [Aliiroseovarius crassostreae]SFU75522.1 hypothetical protein SAMN04488527_11459 [Aliiroseovarius crassostreae]